MCSFYSLPTTKLPLSLPWRPWRPWRFVKRIRYSPSGKEVVIAHFITFYADIPEDL